jgi:hypothetical protein
MPILTIHHKTEYVATRGRSPWLLHRMMLARAMATTSRAGEQL